MTRKDFEAIADCLNQNHAPLTMVQDFADMCEESNPRFNRPLFITAATRELRKDAQADLRAFDREGVL